MCLLAYYDKLELGTQALANLALLPKVSEDRSIRHDGYSSERG
jgi:hypothetical protein